MTTLEPDPREYDAIYADVDLDMRATMQHHIGSLAQLSTAGSNFSVSIQPILAKQSDEVASWTIPSPHALERTARSLRILMVATEAPPVRSGIARAVGYLWHGFQERGHHVDVLAYPQIGRLEFREVRLSSFIYKFPQLLRRINEYDVIHVHGTTPTISDVALFFLHFARLRGLDSVVIYTHHMDLDFRPGGFLNRAYNHLHHRLSARTDAVIVSTQDNLRLLGDSCQGFVIPYGVDLEHFCTNGQKDAQFTVLFIGQFRPYKGVRVLLQAMSQVTGARLLLAGQGPEEQAYRSLVAELGLNVEFHIAVDDDQLRQLYQRAHAVVLPSVTRAEAFGLVLMEGMVAGCVPIASDLPGVREAVGPTGFLFPPGDAKSLAGILRRLRDDPALVQQIGDRARVRAAEFSQERSISAYEHLITALIAYRDLKNRLADQTQSCASALHAFATDVARDLEADWTEIMLQSTQDELYPIASTEPSSFLDHRQLQQVPSLLAQYAIDTGDSILLGPNNGPLRLGNVIVRGMPAAMVTPLTVDGEHFGALLSMRKRPFDQRDLSRLTHLARYTAPLLCTLVEKVDI